MSIIARKVGIGMGCVSVYVLSTKVSNRPSGIGCNSSQKIRIKIASDSVGVESGRVAVAASQC